MTSLATYIRDQAYQRLTTGPIRGNWKSSRRVPLPSLQSQDLPALAVYLLRESLNPDGDANVGVPRFVGDAYIGISVIDSADKPECIDGSLDSMVDLIEDTLLQDITFVSLAGPDGNQLIEGFESLQRSYNFPQIGESYYIEVRLQLQVRYRCYFQPITPNALTDVNVSVQPFDGTVQSGEYTSDITLPQT